MAKHLSLVFALSLLAGCSSISRRGVLLALRAEDAAGVASGRR